MKKTLLSLAGTLPLVVAGCGGHYYDSYHYDGSFEGTPVSVYLKMNRETSRVTFYDIKGEGLGVTSNWDWFDLDNDSITDPSSINFYGPDKSRPDKRIRFLNSNTVEISGYEFDKLPDVKHLKNSVEELVREASEKGTLSSR